MAGTHRNIVLACSVLASALSAGCDGAGRSIAEGLQGELAAERAAACVRAGQVRDKSVLPLLVERLEDSDADVRLFAIVALEKITGQSLGYHYYGPLDERSEAVRRWRNWLRQQQEKNSGG